MNEIDNETEMQEMVADLIKGFTRFHDDLCVWVVETPKTINISVEAHADDVPKIIGSGAQTVQALQCICNHIAARRGLKANLTVQEPMVGERMDQDRFIGRDEDAETEQLLALRLMDMIYSKVEVTSRRLNRNSHILLITVGDETFPNEVVELERAMGTVFLAIGKANGKNITLEIDCGKQRDPHNTR